MGIRVFVPDKESGIAEVRTRLPTSIIGKTNRTNDLLDLQDATYVVPYMMSSGAVVGRGVTGPGFDVVPFDLNADGSEAKRKKILKFFNYSPDNAKNIKDTLGPLAKLYSTAFMYRLYGHAAWQIVREPNTKKAIGFDFVPGIIKPNIDSNGFFKRPAYVQYLRSGKAESKTEFNNPDDIIYFHVPDFGSGIWLAEVLSLSDYSLPSEIYAARAYRSLHENRNAPHSGVWYTPSDIDEKTFKRFTAMINRRYTGSGSYGKNPIVMKGEGGFKPMSIPREDAPYIDGRELNRREIAAASGVPGPKYGVDIENVSANALKEIRKEFYESTLRPTMSLIEEVIYTQICIKLFGAPEWRFKFNRPDFTTAVEDASIELRRIQWGQWSPNEARASRGEMPRDDGDYYLVPMNMEMQNGMEGRPDEDAVDNDEGDLEQEEEDTVPDAESPEVVEAITEELRKWRKFELRIARGQRNKREFVPHDLPWDLYKFIRRIITEANGDANGIRIVFDDALELLSEG